MRSLTYRLVVVMSIFHPIFATHGQNISATETMGRLINQSAIGDLIEKSAEATETEQDYSGVADDGDGPAGKQVDLNSATREEFQKIPFLDSRQRENLALYLIEYGDLLSFYEILSVPGFDSALIRKIEPYIRLTPRSPVPKPSPRNLVRYGRHALLIRGEQSFPGAAGYMEGDTQDPSGSTRYYPGSPQRYYFRYQYSWFDRLAIGIAGEKDPGEQFFSGAQSKGMDYYALSLALSNIGWLRKLVIGNFRASFGQGLTMGTGMSLVPAPGFVAGASRTTGIRADLSMNEGGYLRGLATTVKVKGFEISTFGSYHPRDASISGVEVASPPGGNITSLQSTGLHRTLAELDKRNRVNELVCGGNFSFSAAPNQELSFRAGVTGVFTRYSLAIEPKAYAYNRFVFRGRENLVTGVDLQLRFKGLYLFGEGSRSLNGGLAGFAGVTLSPDPRFLLYLAYRHYGISYQNLFSQSFGQGTSGCNERGLYVNISSDLSSKLTISGYLDLFTFPWIKYRADAPSRGYEAGLMLTWRATRLVTIDLRGYGKCTRKNEPVTGSHQLIHRLGEHLLLGIRSGFVWTPGNSIHLATRIEWKGQGFTGGTFQPGCLLFQEIRIISRKPVESISLRFALFDVAGYESRIYVFEPEVLYGYSVPAYQGRGIRVCSVIKWRIFRDCFFWIRGGVTVYTDREVVGTGYDMTNGNARAELTGQLQVKL